MEIIPIRIAHIVGKWLGGGVEAVLMNYYRNIDRSIIQFDFICDNDSTDIPYNEIEKLGGRIYEITPYQHLSKYINDLYDIFKENDYKIVHSHINTLSVFPLYAAKKAGVPIRIAHSHSTTNRKEFKRNILKQILRPFSKINATNYMACSDYAGKWLFGTKKSKCSEVFLMNNGIDLKRFRFNEDIRNIYRRKLKISDDTLVVGHVGRFVEQKNHEFIINIFCKLLEKEPKSLLILLGKGPLQDHVKELAIKKNIVNQIIFLGQQEKVNNYYMIMDVFILPSLYEGFGLVALEAQASGLPVIVSENVPLEVNITNEVKFLSLNSEPEIWADMILTFRSLKRNNTINNFDYDIKENATRLQRKYLELIEKMVNL